MPNPPELTARERPTGVLDDGLDADAPGDGSGSHVARARRKAHILYEGALTPHRSCGVCLAETFGLPWRSYQALRRGGLTGEGSCGAIRAGEMVLGELLGPPGPEDPVGERLRTAIIHYQQLWKIKQAAEGWTDTICNTLTAPLGDFKGPRRMDFCTVMAADAAEFVAQSLVRVGEPFEITAIPGMEDGADRGV